MLGMHGEYKVPGGKLVVADLDVAGEVVRRARISGDFFLEPDDALERINGALAGVPVGAPVAQLAARVRGALGEGVEMLGFSPEAVAVAVRRALTGASAWTDHAWQFVHDVPREPALQMALDEVLAEQVGSGERPPTLRIWEWASNAVIIGSFQSLRQRGRPGRRRSPRRDRRTPDQWRRRDVRRARQHDHVLAVRARVARLRAVLRRLLRVPRRLGDHRAQRARHRRDVPADQRHHLARRQDRGRRAEAVRGRRGPASRDDGLRHGCREDGARYCGSVARSSPTRAPRAPTSASTRCAARPVWSAAR